MCSCSFLLFPSVKIMVISWNVKMMQTAICDSVKTHWHYFPVGVTTRSWGMKKGRNVVMCVKPSVFYSFLTFYYIYFKITLALMHRHLPQGLILTRCCRRLISHMVLEASVPDTQMQWCLSGSLSLSSSSNHGKLAVHIMTSVQKKTQFMFFFFCFYNLHPSANAFFFLSNIFFSFLLSPPFSVFMRRWTVAEAWAFNLARWEGWRSFAINLSWAAEAAEPEVLENNTTTVEPKPVCRK